MIKSQKISDYARKALLLERVRRLEDALRTMLNPGSQYITIGESEAGKKSPYDMAVIKARAALGETT